MALNIKNREVERLAAEVAKLTGESKTEAIRRALEERKNRLAPRDTVAERYERLLARLEEFWAQLPPDVRGKPISKAEREEILGYGPDGV
jgi:antitoxin VapB